MEAKSCSANNSIFDATKVVSVLPLPHISYWQYTRLQSCILSGLYPYHTEVFPSRTEFITYNRRQILGKIFHKIMEDINFETKHRGRPAPARIKELCISAFSAIEESLITEAGDARYANLSRWQESGLVYAAVNSIQQENNSLGSKSLGTNKADVLSEKSLMSLDKKISGRPDLIVKKGDFISVFDYKFCSLNEITPEMHRIYTDQMLLYAALIEDQFGAYPARACLIGKGGARENIALNKEASIELKMKMNLCLADVNKRINFHAGSVTYLTNPSDSACAFCEAKPWCPGFRRDAANLNLPKSRQIIFGFQSDNLVESRRAGAMLRIRPVFTSMNQEHEEFTITRINRAWFPKLLDQPGQALIINNLVGDKFTPAAAVDFDTQIVSLGTK